jgi:hypothetical protein
MSVKTPASPNPPARPGGLVSTAAIRPEPGTAIEPNAPVGGQKDSPSQESIEERVPPVGGELPNPLEIMEEFEKLDIAKDALTTYASSLESRANSIEEEQRQSLNPKSPAQVEEMRTILLDRAAKARVLATSLPISQS